MKTGILELQLLDRAYVTVVQLKTQMPGVIHQVTLRPDKVHEGLIRLGETPNDELMGWNHPENIYVIALLGVAKEEQGKWVCEPLGELKAVA